MMQKNNAKKIFIVFIFSWSFQVHSQPVSLPDFIFTARANSYMAQSTKFEVQLATLLLTDFKLTNRPLLSFAGNIPGYNKDNYAITQPDGSIKFLPRSQNYSNIGFSFTQPLLFSGGSISINTDLYRFDNFTTHSKEYYGTPFFVKLFQPLFKYNSYKSEKQIISLKKSEADQTYLLAQHQIDYDACRLFFSVISAQEDEKLAAANLENNTANLTIEKRRFQLGVSTEDNVIGLEMQQIDSRQQQAMALLSIRKAFAELNNYFNSTDTTIKTFQLPEMLPAVLPDKKMMLEQAKLNLPQYISFDRMRKENETKIAEAKMQGREIDLNVSYGLNNTSVDLPAIYHNPQTQQRFSIGINMPKTDGGRRKNKIAIAKTQQEQTEVSIKKEEANLMSEISMLTDEIYALKNNVVESLQFDSLAEKRYKITNRLFQSGKASLLELQASQTEKDNARKKYIIALQKFWESWYLLKAKTLTD